MNAAKRRAYQEKANAELRALGARIDQMLARAETQKAAGKIEMYERLEKLGEQRDTLRERLAELRETSGDAWDDVREGFEQAIHDLSGALHTAVGRYREETDESKASFLLSARGLIDNNASPGM